MDTFKYTLKNAFKYGKKMLHSAKKKETQNARVYEYTLRCHSSEFFFTNFSHFPKNTVN